MCTARVGDVEGVGVPLPVPLGVAVVVDAPDVGSGGGALWPRGALGDTSVVVGVVVVGIDVGPAGATSGWFDPP
jgi:hypothetical protein